MPTVSILIVAFRSYPELTACLSSLQPFVARNVEVIVVDHESQVEEAAAVRARYPWVRLVEVQANPGFAAGVNRAANHATGAFLLLLNPDCVVDQNVVDALTSFLESQPTVAVCGPLIRESDGEVQPSARRFPSLSTGFAGRRSWLRRVWPGNPWSTANLAASSAPIEVDWVSGACLTIRRSAFDQAGGMDEGFFMYWEDADLCRRLKSLGWSTVYCPVVAVTHLTGRSSATARVRSAIAFHRSAFRYYLKHGTWLARLLAPLAAVALGGRLVLELVMGLIKPDGKGSSSSGR